MILQQLLRRGLDQRLRLIRPLRFKQQQRIRIPDERIIAPFVSCILPQRKQRLHRQTPCQAIFRFSAAIGKMRRQCVEDGVRDGGEGPRR